MKTPSPTNAPVHPSAEQIFAFVNEIERAYMLDRPRPYGSDRRAVERMNLTIPLELAPLDDELRPLGYQHHAITRDISSKGVGLVATSPVPPSYVMLTFKPCQSKPFRVIAKVAYCKDVGYYHQIGCEFQPS